MICGFLEKTLFSQSLENGAASSNGEFNAEQEKINEEHQAQVKELKDELTRLSEDYSAL